MSHVETSQSKCQKRGCGGDLAEWRELAGGGTLMICDRYYQRVLRHGDRPDHIPEREASRSAPEGRQPEVETLQPLQAHIDILGSVRQRARQLAQTIGYGAREGVGVRLVLDIINQYLPHAEIAAPPSQEGERLP